VTPTANLAAALRLVVLLDPDAASGRDLADVAARAIAGGTTMLQVRGKRLGAAELAALTRRVLAAAGAVPVIVNDRFDVALATRAAGCHLGQDDFPLAEARALAPAGFLIGASAGTPEEATRSLADGADYVGIGPIHSTPSKSDAGSPIGIEGFARVHAAAATLPAVAIGGVTARDAAPLRAAGAAGLAVISSVVSAADPERAARELRAAFDAAAAGR
jgi:thiamine-phosphate pyrophosphorylase